MSISLSLFHRTAHSIDHRTNKAPETSFFLLVFSLTRATVREIFLVYLSCFTSR
jgi:hypothetical protein